MLKEIENHISDDHLAYAGLRKPKNALPTGGIWKRRLCVLTQIKEKNENEAFRKPRAQDNDMTSHQSIKQSITYLEIAVHL